MTAIDENGYRLIEFRYPSGRVEQISLADGRNYKIVKTAVPTGYPIQYIPI